jgi:hypothetical protein
MPLDLLSQPLVAPTHTHQGKDATEEFEPIHPPDTLEKYLPKDKHLGPVDMTTVVKEKTEESPEEAERLKRIQEMPCSSSATTCSTLRPSRAAS